MQLFWQRLKIAASVATNERGSTAILFAVCLTMLVSFVGAAIDGTRFFTAKRQHANAIDIALLSGARRLQIDATDTNGALTIAASMYKANLPKNVVITNNTVVFSQDTAAAAVTYTGRAFIGTVLLGAVGISRLDITMPAKASYKSSGGNGGSNLEIAVMLDVTGSMCDNGTGPCTSGVKISGLKAAAGDLANIVLGTTSPTYSSRIALVPFSSAVRIAPDGAASALMQQLTGMPSTWTGYVLDYSQCPDTGSYAGEIFVNSVGCAGTPVLNTNMRLIPCVTERSFDNGIGFDPGDSPPGSGNWLLAHGGDRSVVSWDSSDAPMTSYTGATAAQASSTWNYSSDGSGCVLPPGNEIMPLTSDLHAVTGRIDTLNAFGSTAGALGTVWTEYMLSPNWAGIWSSSQRPGAYADTQTRQSNGAPLLRKVAVLLTDGGFNTGRQAVSTDSAYMQTISNRAISVCTAMKKNGVEIYTVGFDMASLGGVEAAIAETTMKACGTDISHFYNSLSVSELQSAFRDIALKLSPIRLSQ